MRFFYWTMGVLILGTLAPAAFNFLLFLFSGEDQEKPMGVLSGGGSSQVRSVGGVPIEIPLKSGAAASFARVTYHASSPLAAIKGSIQYLDPRRLPGDDREFLEIIVEEVNRLNGVVNILARTIRVKSR